MEAGTFAALLGVIKGEYTCLNDNLYSAIDVMVDGEGNEETNIHLQDGAVNIYDFLGEGGFVVVGGCGGLHVGVCVSSLGDWTRNHTAFGLRFPCGADCALSTWMQNAFGADVRVTMPVISLRLDDTQATCGEHNPAVMDFIEANKQAIRASGFLVTDLSAYRGCDTTLQADEQIISQWGSMSLHGKDHAMVGAEGLNRSYQEQWDDMQIALGLLDQNFIRHKRIKACPNNSWNEATLHAMFDNAVYYHSAYLGKSDAYAALYKSLFSVDSQFERERIYARATAGQLRYYPLIHTDETGTAEIYSVDWGPVVCATTTPAAVILVLGRYALDWWTPMLVGAHFCLPNSGGANTNPDGWMDVMEALIDCVGYESYPMRRWVDTYDFASNVRTYDLNLEVNSMLVSGDQVTYDLYVDDPIRFLTLKAGRDGHKVKSVHIGGEEHVYFGDDYVHLPEVVGNALVEVCLTAEDNVRPHITYIDPSAVIEQALLADDKIEIVISGEFDVVARVEKSAKVFRNGKTVVFAEGGEHLQVDASSYDWTRQVEMELTPASGSVDVEVECWEVSDTYYRKWLECTVSPLISVGHAVGDLPPGQLHTVIADRSAIDTCLTDAEGRLFFEFCPGCSICTMEVICDSTAFAGIGPGESDETRNGAGTLTVVPNPFTSRICLHFRLVRPSYTDLGVYSPRGRRICALCGQVLPAGQHRFEWARLDDAGNRVSPGLYVARLTASGVTHTRKIALAR
jgi:hypothetical protein